MKQPEAPDNDVLSRAQRSTPDIRRLLLAVRRFRLHGPRLFVAGLELWYLAQVHWFSSSFRLQALGVTLLAYWILVALWCMRDP
jgi:hypothetical protein